MPEISVIIPAYNAARFIGETLDSVLRQEFASWECIVVDDGSTDDTGAKVEHYVRQDARIRLVTQDNAGVSAARNRGLAESSVESPYVIFLDADDVWRPASLRTLHEALAACTSAVASHCATVAFEERGSQHVVLPNSLWPRSRTIATARGVRTISSSAMTTFEVMVTTNCIRTPGSALVRRSALPTDRPFDTHLSYVEDWDLWTRLSRTGPIIFCSEILLDYRKHSSNASNVPNLDGKLRDYWRKTVRSTDNTEQQRCDVVIGYHYWKSQVVKSKLEWAAKDLLSGHAISGGRQLIRALRTASRSYI